jgi:hypothetical protein
MILQVEVFPPFLMSVLLKYFNYKSAPSESV